MDITKQQITEQLPFLRVQEFNDKVERLMVRGTTAIDAALTVGEEMQIEPEVVGRMVGPVLRSKIEQEAEEANYFTRSRKRSKIPQEIFEDPK